MTLLLCLLSLCPASEWVCEFWPDLMPEPGAYCVSVRDAEGQWYRGLLWIEPGVRDYTVVVEPITTNIADVFPVAESGVWPWAAYDPAHAGRYVQVFQPDERAAWKWWR